MHGVKCVSCDCRSDKNLNSQGKEEGNGYLKRMKLLYAECGRTENLRVSAPTQRPTEVKLVLLPAGVPALSLAFTEARGRVQEW
jgi:hypothetical protein